MKRFSACLIALSVAVLGAGQAAAQEHAASPAKQASQRLLLKQAQRMVVTVGAGSDVRKCELKETPLIHYSDQVRQLPESSLWVWQRNGRPTVFCKVERVTDGEGATKSWQYCCVPATDQKIEVQWGSDLRWQSREYPFRWNLLASETAPSPQAAARLSQIKAIAREFSGATEQPESKSKQTMRLLASPLHRFESLSNNVLEGAVFGLTSNGTNPDALVIIEALDKAEADARWRYAVLGMTADAVSVRRLDKTVYTKAFSGSPGDQRSWMWYTHVP